MLSHLRRVMSEFITNETGFVRQRTGLPVAWAAGVLVAAAVILGTPGTAAACGGTPCDWIGSCVGWPSGQCNYLCITQGHACGECRQEGTHVWDCQCYH